MIKAWRLRHAAEHQFGNLRKILKREPVSVAPLGSMTLDYDDVLVARHWLVNRGKWFDRDVVRDYEVQFARFNGSKHAYALMGGRVALSAALHAVNCVEGDQVILPGYTCVVVPNALSYAGLEPIYCDIELDTYGLDAAAVEAAITPKTRVLLLQHLYGLVCRDYEQLLEIAARRGIAVIEDCAHATGAEFKGLKVGNRGHLGFYSSEQSKVFNTIQGGVVVTNDDTLANRLEEFRDHAPYPTEAFIEKLLHNVILQYYGSKHRCRWWTGDVADIVYGESRLISTSEEEMRGQRPQHYGCRMPAPVAALGLNQLRKLPRYNALRRETARKWDDWCVESGHRRPTVVPDSLPVFLRYPVLVDPEMKSDRSWARHQLGVEAGDWFTGSLHPVRGTLTQCPQAALAVATCVNLPCLLSLTPSY